MVRIIRCRQRSAYWFYIRSKKLTASRAQAIGNNGKGLQSYIRDMVEIYYGLKERDDYTNSDIERGIELERSAKFLYGMKTGLTCCNPGFVLMDDYVGCSPDFLQINPLVGCEIKSPNEENHKKNLSGKIQSQYMWQIQMSLYICGLDSWDFASFNPDFPEKEQLYIRRIDRDNAMVDKLKEGIKTGKRLIKEFSEEFEKKNIITI